MHTEDLLNTAVEAALAAGDLLRQGFGTHFSIESKPGMQNLVTEYDKASEKQIIAAILSQFPDHNILAEESGQHKKTKSPYTWIIDPLDGTVNFAHGVPIFSVSIAVAKEKEVIAGVILQPLLNELFIAEKGKGATLNGKAIHVTQTDQLENALTATGFPYNVDTNPRQCIDYFAKMTARGVPIRRLGSAAIDLAYVACGRFDVYWEVSVQPWDMAAGKIIVEEAGGKVTHYNGEPHAVFYEDTILASNGILHAPMLQFLNAPV